MARRSGPHWRGTVLYIPVLYAAGWLLVRPLTWLAPHWRGDQVDLAGAATALILLLATLPLRLHRCWGTGQPWQTLGLAIAWPRLLSSGFGGLLKALLLLLFISSSLLLLGQAQWQPLLQGPLLLNALALLLGVGFAEELLFRGWLWGELAMQLSAGQARLAQALIFALVHPWYRQSGWQSGGLLLGLLLLGLVLAQQRQIDDGSLWGAIGLHGGLVGGWFLVQKGLMVISPTAPGWLVGPGSGDVNPIGSALGVVILAGVLVVQRRAVARAARP